MKNLDIDGEDLIVSATIIIVFLIIVLGIAIPCLVSEKRNIEKELILKEYEIYGERINKDE